MSAHTEAYSHLNNFRWHQGSPDMHPDEAKLRDLAALRDEIDDIIAITIHNSDDLTWTAVGEIMGMTRQGATKRYSRLPSEVAIKQYGELPT